MKKYSKLLIIILLSILFITLSVPSKTASAATKYIVDGESNYTIVSTEKLYLYVDTSKTVKWSTSNSKVVAVSSKGTLIGKSKGTATITAKVGKKKYKSTITVYKDYSDWVIYKTDDMDFTLGGMYTGDVVYDDYNEYYLVAPDYYDDVMVPFLDELREQSESNPNPYSTADLAPDTDLEWTWDSEDEEDADDVAAREARIEKILQGNLSGIED